MKLKLGLVIFAGLLSFSATAVERSANVERASFNKSITPAMKSVVSLYATKNVANLADNVDAAIYGTKVNVRAQNSLGSGVIVSKDGLIITNSHIVKDSQDIKVVVEENKTYMATVVDVDTGLDLAIIKIINTTDKFNAIEFADSGNLLIGDRVFAIGNPFGVGQSVSMGIISAIGRAFNIENADYLIQTDAAINPGNSGGALIDVDGRLVGLNSAIFSKTEAFSGVGFAVPANALRFALDTLETTGSVKRAWLGARGQDISKHLQSGLKLKSNKGIYIDQITPNGPASKAKINIGDVLTKINGQEVTNNKALGAILKTATVGKKIPAQVIRNSRMLELEIILKPIKRRIEEDKFIIRGNNMLHGLMVERLSPELNHMLNLSLDSKGVAIIDRPQHLANNNIQVGDIILKVNKTEINDLPDLKEILSKPTAYGMKLTLQRAGREVKIFIK